MSAEVKPVPETHHTLTPHLTVKGASDAIAFYEKAFGVIEQCRMLCPQSGKIMHSQLKIGDSVFHLVDEFDNCGPSAGPLKLGGTPVVLHLYVEDVDSLFQQATDAGATVRMPLMDMFWGDRYGQLVDPFGHVWSLATKIANPSPEEMQERMEAMMAAMPA